MTKSEFDMTKAEFDMSNAKFDIECSVFDITYGQFDIPGHNLTYFRVISDMPSVIVDLKDVVVVQFD